MFKNIAVLVRMAVGACGYGGEWRVEWVGAGKPLLSTFDPIRTVSMFPKRDGQAVRSLFMVRLREDCEGGLS